MAANPLIYPAIFSGIILFMLAIIGLVQHRTHGARTFALLTFFVGVAAFGQTGQVLARDLSYFFWVNLTMITILVGMTFWLIFLIEYFGFNQWANKRVTLLLFIEPALFVIVLLTNPWHQLFRAHEAIDITNGYTNGDRKSVV